MAAKNNARRTIIRTDMEQLVGALENFKTSIGNGQYPPDGTIVADLQQFCKAAWPRVYWVTGSANYNTSPPQVPYPKITPDTALCFWLGGAQDASGGFVGFSANPTNPFDYGQSRTPTIFELVKTRVNKPLSATPNLPSGGGFFYNLYQYYPPNGKDMTSGTYAPYVYYKAVPLPPGAPSSSTVYTIAQNQNAQQGWAWPPDPNIKYALPYYDSTPPINPPQAFVNPQSYQLLCPGLDGIYGATTDKKPPQYPSGTNYDPNNGIDDMTNFTQGVMVGNDTK
jgi:hypothetical protein